MLVLLNSRYVGIIYGECQNVECFTVMQLDISNSELLILGEM